MQRRSLFALPLAASGTARAQGFPDRPHGFPDRPVTLVVPYAPGGTADVLARVLGPAMAERLGQPVVIELRGGAGGNIGAAHVASGARADGHTLLLGSLSLASAPALQAIPFDPLRDLVPVAGLGAVPNLLVVSPDSPFHGVADLLAAARARPRAISYGSSGPGTGSHLAGEQLAAQTGVELLHVPYRGSGAVYPDLIAGRIDVLLDAMGSAIGQVQAGAVRAIGITSGTRSPVLPAVPTLAEQRDEPGLAGFAFLIWLGLFARAGTPDAVFRRLEAVALQALDTQAVQDRLRQAAAVPIPREAAGFGRWYAAEVARWQALVREGKLARLD